MGLAPFVPVLCLLALVKVFQVFRAAEMALDADRDRLLRHAAELEAEAADLERQATGPVTHVQPPGYSVTQTVQQAQQHTNRPSRRGSRTKRLRTRTALAA